MRNINQYFQQTASDYGVPLDLAQSVLGQESGGDQGVTSGKGATGYMQLMPGTAADLGVDRNDPYQNVEGGLRYLSQLYNHYGNWDDAVRGYNAGYGRVDAWKAGKATLPAETVNYHGKIMSGLGGGPAPASDPSVITGGGSSDQLAGGTGTPPDVDPDLDAVPVPGEGGAPQTQAVDPDLDAVPVPGEGGPPQGPDNLKMGRGQVINSVTGGRYPKGIEDAIVAYNNSGKLDPNAAPGSAGLPMAVTDPDQYKALQPGQYYVDVTGVHQLPETLKADDGAGFIKGFLQPGANVLRWTDNAVRNVPLLGNAVEGAAKLATGGQSLTQALDAYDGYDAQLAAQGKRAGKLGQFVGGMVGLGPLAEVAPEAEGGAALLSAMGQGVVGGALTSDAKDANGLIRDAAFGGLTGGALHGVGQVAANVVAPKLTVAAKLILDNGGSLTPGMMMGGFGKKIEDGAAQMLPWVSAAQRRASDDFTSKVVPNYGLNFVDDTLPKGTAPGYDTNTYMKGAVKGAYDDILPNVSVRVDSQMKADQAAVLSKSSTLSAPDKAEFDRHMDNIFGPQRNRLFDRNGVMSGDNYQSAYSDLGTLANEYNNNPLNSRRELGGTLQDVQSLLDNAMARQNQTYAPKIAAARKAAQVNMIMRDAANKASAEGGVSTPRALASAVRNHDGSYRGGAFYTGDAFGQDLGDAAQVIPNSIPNNGASVKPLLTLGAVEAAGRMIPGVGAVMNGLPPEVITAGAGAAMVGHGLAYSPAAIKAMNAFANRKVLRSDALANVLRKGRYGLFGGAAPALWPTAPPLGTPGFQ